MSTEQASASPTRPDPSRAEPDSVLSGFGQATRTWFAEAFDSPTAAQREAWQAIRRGDDTLVVAPTGSGKTLAAFLTAIDRLMHADAASGEPEEYVRVLYVSPLKALAADVDRNLRRPLRGIAAVAQREAASREQMNRQVTVGVRTGDTPPDQRRALAAHPPDILITTPESLFLMLTSAARESLARVEMVIIDEIHSLAGTKRGAHLAVSLERLDSALPRRAQRIGLSATVRPLDEVGRYLTGGRPVAVVQPPAAKTWDLRVVVPVEDMGALGQVTDNLSGTAAGAEKRTSIWPHVEERLADLIAEHRSTLVFANSRRLAERLTTRLNEIWDDRRDDHARHEPGDPSGGQPDEPSDGPSGAERHRTAALMGATTETSRARPHPDAPVLARAHHGSVSREQRSEIEEALKAGLLPVVVATSSLELGIDMGDIDLVAQVEAPPSVASGLQRVGRAGHQVGATSRGVFFPKYRGDLVQTAVVAERMRVGLIEAVSVPANPLDVLAQQVVAMCAMDEWQVDDLLALMRRTASFATLSRSVLESVLDMLAGRYPSDEFAELRPRIVWDRATDVLSGRPGAQRLAVTSGGTIPDRGLFGVFLDGDGPGRRVGELDEEMVYESRVGDVFTLGTSSWRIQEITHDQVRVVPAPGEPGRLPFWKGDTVGRAAELGAAVGGFVREVAGLTAESARARLTEAGLDDWASDNLRAYLTEQAEATGVVPSDTTIVVERFRDELGDWRIVLHSPYGSRVHAPWALAIGSRLRERFGFDVQAMHGDDGIVLRLPDVELPDDATDGAFMAELADLVTLDPDDVTELVTSTVGGSALFASRFRECAGRALLLPRRRPDKRAALWQQRQRSAQLLQVASRYPEFPIVLEAVRECLQDVFDVPALTALMRDIAARRVRIVTVDTTSPSPFARSLLFGYVAQFLYEGDSPLAERRAAALALDPSLLAELLGTQASLRELLELDVVQRTEVELQHLVPDRFVRHAEDAVDLIRRIGPLTTDEVRDRTREDGRAAVESWLSGLVERRRIMPVSIAGESRWAVVEDAARLLDGLGVALPTWVPEQFTQHVADPLGDLVARYARSHGPFTAAEVARRLGIGEAVARDALRRLVAAGRVAEGDIHPAGSSLACRGVGPDFCDAQVLRLLRRRSLAALRSQVEPVTPHDLARFLPVWQGITDDQARPRPAFRGVDGLMRAIEQLDGVRLPASALEALVLPARVAGYAPAMLDELLASGAVVWQGRGASASDDGWVSLHPAETAPLTLAQPVENEPVTDTAPGGFEQSQPSLTDHVIEVLSGGGGFFVHQLLQAVRAARPGDEITPTALEEALWEAVWAGRVTNDTFAPLRAVLSRGHAAHRSRRTPSARTARPRRLGRLGGLSGPGSPGRTNSAMQGGSARTAGRWSLLPQAEVDPTSRAVATAEVLLDRYGVLTRGPVAAEEVTGGFAAMYRVLAAAEESGAVRRGYLVEQLGASQFATAGAIDRLRAVARGQDSLGASPGSATTTPPPALVLAATDPANPYGAALDWPDSATSQITGVARGHRPARKAGALVVSVDGRLVAYLERGGRSVLTFPSTGDGDGGDASGSDRAGSDSSLTAAAESLAQLVRHGALDTLTVTSIDGDPALGSDHALAHALEQAGFHMTPKGLRMRRA
ncbi:MAG: ATP-dependent helicase [Dermatophilus congolensis]|nr:ATP-dependent helicase [Dermatophilus congolensis]